MVLVVLSPGCLLIKGRAWAFRGLDGARELRMKRGCIARLLLLMGETCLSFVTCGGMRSREMIKRKRSCECLVF